MLPAGKSLRTLREKLGLTMRDVENSSARVADKYRNEEFSIPPSRLSDIETKGILPSIFRLYTLSVIYRRDFRELMSWYGVDLNNLPADFGLVSPPKSHYSDALAGVSSVQVPVRMDPGFDERRTSNLGRMVEQWGVVPLSYLAQFAKTDFTYGYVGTQDFTMYPILPPGSFIQVDESQKQSTGRLLAVGVRTSHLFCGNPRRPYLLLVQHAPRRSDSATASVVSGSGPHLAPSPGSRGSRPGRGGGYEVDRVARARFFSRVERASSTELR